MVECGLGVGDFGENLAANREFLKWLGRLRGGSPTEDVSVKLNPASHLCYTFQFQNGAGIHVKFYGIPTGSCKDYDSHWAMKNEYKILKSVYDNGFTDSTHRVIIPLGTNTSFYSALATEYVGDVSLSKIMMSAAEGGEESRILSEALANTAYVLKRIHDTMPRSDLLDSEFEFSRLTEDTTLGIRDEGLKNRIVDAIAGWAGNPEIAALGAATVHGDANPTNFVVKDGVLYVLDFERLEHNRSPLLDLGYMIADLKHHFKFFGGNPDAAEPYIKTFLKSYSPQQYEKIRELVNPYVGCGLLRINNFINADRKHRNWLLSEGFHHLL